MLKDFRADPHFLTRYYVGTSLLFCGLAFVAVELRPPADQVRHWAWALGLLPFLISSFAGALLSTAFFATKMLLEGVPLSPADWIWIPIGIYWGMVNVPLIHNCAHRSFRPRWINRFLGEFFSLQILSSYPGFEILHLRHHRYADDPEWDPHPNYDQTFWQYMNGLKRSLGRAYRKLYFQTWGDDATARRNLGWFLALIPIGRVVRAHLILSILGGKYFCLFFIPAFLANQLTYAHINYFTHPKDKGEPEIVDLEAGGYRLLNAILFGIYRHRAHHRNPGRFFPK